ncbi:glycoside hydrolase family 27 protein [Amniculicola lignicola CBS 123094]|uniref:Alpha-galactosidase n=1 Tax=Amniculicola lignicola CBS 123094 TaxID=1392246 RepID=A0A6A5W5K7_9PLEO|nr:glycoside hydrolase family 27 protein [Amniculicola lignicola CBS 123094]
MDASKRKAGETLDSADMEKVPYHVTHGSMDPSKSLLDKPSPPPRHHVRGATFWTLLVATFLLLTMVLLRGYYQLGLGLLPLSPPVGFNQTVGRLPALGWNSWNAFHCNINEDKFITAAKRLIELGLKDVGYEYVNIDDCWQVREYRHPTTNQLIPDPGRFPNGIKGTADKVHALGLKIGIYSSAGDWTCAGYRASLGYEELDAKTWSDWDIDYLKYDNCYVPNNWADECRGCVPEYPRGDVVNGTCTNPTGMCPPGYNYTTSKTALRFRRMRDALLAQPRPILYSLCEWGEAGVQQWANETGVSWRMSGDINPSWPRILEILNQNSFYLNNVDFWGHSDADMLEVGNGLSIHQSRSHFALWAAMKSPLLIGCDLETVKGEEVAILKNEYLLAFNQDEYVGPPAKPYKWGTNPDWTFNASFPAEFWSGDSSRGVLVLLFNPYETSRVKQALWEEIPELKGGRYWDVVEVWTGREIGCIDGGFDIEVEGHDTAAFLVTGECVVGKRGEV